MLSALQVKKLEQASKLLDEVNRINTDSTKTGHLEEAQCAVDDLLDAQFLTEHYLENVAQQEKNRTIQIESVLRPWRKTWQDHLFLIASDTAGTALMVSFVSACISLTCWGLSDLKGAMGYKSQPDFAASTQAYRGLAIASLGITLTASTIASLLGAKKNV